MFRCTAVREGQIASDLSIMEELFEENSAELTERQVHKFCSSSVLADKNTRTELHFGRSSSAFVERPCPNMRSFPPGFHSWIYQLIYQLTNFYFFRPLRQVGTRDCACWKRSVPPSCNLERDAQIFVHAGSYFSSARKDWNGKVSCTECKNKHNAGTGRWPPRDEKNASITPKPPILQLNNAGGAEHNLVRSIKLRCILCEVLKNCC